MSKARKVLEIVEAKVSSHTLNKVAKLAADLDWISREIRSLETALPSNMTSLAIEARASVERASDALKEINKRLR